MSSDKTQSAASAEFWLPKHVYMCRADDGFIFLDVKHDKYLGVSADDLEPLRGLLDGWPAEGESGQSTVGPNVEALLEGGLLTRSQELGKSAVPIQVSSIDVDASERAAALRVATTFAHFCPFLYACAWARLTLRLRSMHALVKVVMEGRDQAELSSAARAIELSAVFRRLRPLLFRERGNCLLSALALWRFLQHYGVAATWIIGVKTAPFAAHCWVQHGALLLDGDAGEVSYYTPIFASWPETKCFDTSRFYGSPTA